MDKTDGVSTNNAVLRFLISDAVLFLTLYLMLFRESLLSCQTLSNSCFRTARICSQRLPRSHWANCSILGQKCFTWSISGISFDQNSVQLSFLIARIMAVMPILAFLNLTKRFVFASISIQCFRFSNVQFIIGMICSCFFNRLFSNNCS